MIRKIIGSLMVGSVGLIIISLTIIKVGLIKAVIAWLIALVLTTLLFYGIKLIVD